MLARISLGIGAFIAPQLTLLVTSSPRTFSDPGWFLNAGGNVVTICGVVATVALLVAVRRGWTFGDTAEFGLGVLIAMIGTLLALGAGTLFPIVIVVGGVVLAVAIGLGTALGYVIRLASGRMLLSLSHRRSAE